MFGGFFAHHDRQCRIERVLVGEIASADERNPHRDEVPGTDRAIDDIPPLISWRIGYAFDRDPHRIAVVGEGQITRDSDRLHAGQNLHTAHDFIKKRRPSRGIRILHFRQVDIKCEQVISAKTRIEISQVHEAVDEKPGADQENERDRDLRDDERAAEALPADAGAGIAAAFF